MDRPAVPNRVSLIAIVILLVLTPAVLLALTVTFLTATIEINISELTLVELVELYLLELMVLVGVGYALYRLVLRLVVHELPATLDELAAESAEDPTENDDADGT